MGASQNDVKQHNGDGNRLKKVNSAVYGIPFFLADALFQQRDHITEGYIPVALQPAGTLPPGLGKIDRFFVIYMSVMGPRSLYPVEQELHGEFQVFGKTGRSPAKLFQKVVLQTDAGSAHSIGKTTVVAGQLPHAVHRPVGSCVTGGDPGVVGVFSVKVALNGPITLLKLGVHFQ